MVTVLNQKYQRHRSLGRGKGWSKKKLYERKKFIFWAHNTCIKEHFLQLVACEGQYYHNILAILSVAISNFTSCSGGNIPS